METVYVITIEKEFGIYVNYVNLKIEINVILGVLLLILGEQKVVSS